MAAFCFFWRIAPSEYWALTLEETNAMWSYRDEIIRAREKQSKQRRKG